VSPEQLATITHFPPAEWRHPELVDYSAATLLNSWRDAAGVPFTLTSDGRTAAENAAASGSSPTSLHLLGRAFDIRWPGNEEVIWRVLEGLFLALGWKPPQDKRSIELEMVHSDRDKHLHLGSFADGRPSRLIVTAD